MQQLRDLWANLEPRKRVIIAATGFAMFVAILGLARLAATPSLSLLYAGLEANAAGDVIQALEQQGIAHEVRAGAIFVDASVRDSIRLKLASEGLPVNSAQGYELLDSLTGFGTTSQMFDAAYWRAKEGELARTILASPTVSAARVHISASGNNPFQRDNSSSASVTVTTTSGNLSGSQAQAIRYLVSSAVATLQPEDVAIIDTVAGLISGVENSQAALPGTQLSDTMRERVLRLLEARVGLGNAMVEVSISTDLESESIRERRIDPASRVAISTDSEEASTETSEAGQGGVTVASNLPDGDAGGGENSQSTNSQTRERINYEISETSREVSRGPGTIKRMTIAVLVNNVAEATPDGQLILQPRSDEELAALSDLVSAVVGLDESRGDVITLKSMEFLQTTPAGTEAVETFWSGLSLNIMSLIQLAVLSIVLLILGLFVLRPILTKAAQANPLPPVRPQQALTANDLEGSGLLAPLTGEIATGDFDFERLPTSVATRGSATGDEGVDPVARLRSLIAERQDETVEILRNWLENKEEKV